MEDLALGQMIQGVLVMVAAAVPDQKIKFTVTTETAHEFHRCNLNLQTSTYAVRTLFCTQTNILPPTFQQHKLQRKQ